ATSGGITTTPVAVQAVPDGHHIGSVCLHDAPSHYTSARNTTSQHHSTTAPQHQRKDNRHTFRQTMLPDSGASVPDVTPSPFRFLIRSLTGVRSRTCGERYRP
ncbi:TPA: hypothetical protein IHJ52_004380, partial [Escherichia coli]|nr:hypothetical protein [Escherichia coli]